MATRGGIFIVAIVLLPADYRQLWNLKKGKVIK